MTTVTPPDLQVSRAFLFCIKVSDSDFPLSEYLGSGLEDFKEEQRGIDSHGLCWQTELWVMILKWCVCVEKAKILLLELQTFRFSFQHLFYFFLVRAPCFF